MATVNIHEAKTTLSRLLERAQSGEEVIIARNGRPVARLTPIVNQPKSRLGGMEGRIWIADDFDATDDDLIAMFYGDARPEPPA